MPHFRKFAIAAALVAGTSGLALVAPVQAKDDKAKPAGPQLKLSPDVLKQAQIAQPALQADNVATAEPAVVAIEAAAKTDDDKYIAQVLRLQLEAKKLKTANAQGKADETPLKAPLEALVANPKTPPENRQQFAYQRGAIAFNEGRSADALVWFNKAKELGYNDPDFAMAIVKAKIDSGDVAGGTADLNATIDQMTAAGKPVPEDYYRYALGQTVKKGLKPDAVTWMKRWLSAYPTSKNYHDAMTIYGLQQGSIAMLDRPQAIDLFRLMRQAKALDAYGYEEYGDKTQKSGYPDEAKAVITEGVASGKLKSGGNAADILSVANKGIASEGPMTALEAKAKAAPTGVLAAQTGDVYLGRGDYAKAVALYQVALGKGSVNTDEVNTHLGEALALSGDKAGAKTAFAAVKTSPRADIAGFWTTWVDHPPTA